MVQFKHIRTLKQFINSSYLENTIKLLFSVLLISFIFSYSSLLPFLLHSFNLYFPTLSIYMTDRNCMFLLFNGLLVLIVRTSGLIGNSTVLETDIKDEHIKKNGESRRSVPELLEIKASVVGETVMEIEDEHGRDDGFLITEDEDKEHENGLLITTEQKEEDEEEFGLVSIEELNKKCDEFIKKMKEGIKIEPNY